MDVSLRPCLVCTSIRTNAQPSEHGDPEATGGAAGLGLTADVQPEEVLERDDVKAYLKGVKVRNGPSVTQSLLAVTKVDRIFFCQLHSIAETAVTSD